MKDRALEILALRLAQAELDKALVQARAEQAEAKLDARLEKEIDKIKEDKPDGDK